MATLARCFIRPGSEEKHNQSKITWKFSNIKRRAAQLNDLVVECQPAALKMGVQTLDGEPKNFQYRLLSTETLQPVDHMRHKAGGCLVLGFYAEASKRPWTSLNEWSMCQTPSLLIIHLLRWSPTLEDASAWEPWAMYWYMFVTELVYA